MIKIIFLLIFILIRTDGYGQIQDSLIKNHKKFYNLEEALKQPDKVVILILKNKKINEFPVKIFLFNNLQYLDLSKNNIKSLPDSISVLKTLKTLILNKNALILLPNTIGELKNLKQISMNQNNIKGLPDSFGNLENLEVADFWSNELDYFPETIANLKKIKRIDLRGIQIPQIKQNHIKKLLPKAYIYFSQPCNCAY